MSATRQDALERARATFLADARVDMQTLAAELGIARATLHRWFQTREQLLDQVLGELAQEFFAASRAQARGDRDDVIVETIRIIVTTTAQLTGVRGFVRREPELALRLLVGERFSVRRQLREGMHRLVADVLPDEAGELGGLADAVVAIGVALSWPTLVAGDEPSGDQIAQLTRALLAGARAGALPAAAEM